MPAGLVPIHLPVNLAEREQDGVSPWRISMFRVSGGAFDLGLGTLRHSVPQYPGDGASHSLLVHDQERFQLGRQDVSVNICGSSDQP